jgi:arginase family enzyme
MLLVIRHRYPRLANILGMITGIVSLTIAIACGASMTVLILGGGSSIALAVVRYVGKRRQLTSPR